MSLKINPREELIFLMRGFFATPLISSLGKLNIFKNFLNKKFSISELKTIKNKIALKHILEYFIYLNLMELKKKKYHFTNLGKKIFKRTGSFNIIHSYKNYMYEIEKILLSKKFKAINNRIENVIGSGQTNNRKFFPFVKSFIKKKKYEIVFDLGCGSGFFLNEVKNFSSKIKICGSDLSLEAINEAKKKLGNKTKLLRSDAYNSSKWIKWLNSKYKDINRKKILITFWFIIHEISKNNPNRIINFFKEIHKHMPNAHIVAGELVKPDYTAMVGNKYNSIMPEYMLFHNLSGQGVLNHKELLHVLKNIPYKLTKNKNFDIIKNKKLSTPSAVAWLLEPKKSF
jgi:SAM-dependent methyltransferase